MQQEFDAKEWLRTFTAIGGGYALTSAGKICFLTEECTAGDLTASMSQIVGLPDRQEALKLAISARQSGENL